MKYIKTFEQNEEIAFSVGNIVVCIFSKLVDVGTKFKIEEIYTYKEGDNFDMTPINFNELKESQHTSKFFVTVRNLENNNKSEGIWSTRFVSELKYETMKFNI